MSKYDLVPGKFSRVGDSRFDGFNWAKKRELEGRRRRRVMGLEVEGKKIEVGRGGPFIGNGVTCKDQERSSVKLAGAGRCVKSEARRGDNVGHVVGSGGQCRSKVK